MQGEAGQSVRSVRSVINNLKVNSNSTPLANNGQSPLVPRRSGSEPGALILPFLIAPEPSRSRLLE